MSLHKIHGLLLKGGSGANSRISPKDLEGISTDALSRFLNNLSDLGWVFAPDDGRPLDPITLDKEMIDVMSGDRFEGGFDERAVPYSSNVRDQLFPLSPERAFVYMLLCYKFIDVMDLVSDHFASGKTDDSVQIGLLEKLSQTLAETSPLDDAAKLQKFMTDVSLLLVGECGNLLTLMSQVPRVPSTTHHLSEAVH